jgi:hypothetical protein
MVEQQDELQLTVGTEEAVTLKPATVRIRAVRFEEVGEKKSKKLVITCIHPDRKEDPIEISSVKYEFKGKLDTAGLWKNLDSTGMIRKGSALSVLMDKCGCKTVAEFIDKEVPTVQDEKGYLVFKAY